MSLKHCWVLDLVSLLDYIVVTFYLSLSQSYLQSTHSAKSVFEIKVDFGKVIRLGSNLETEG